MTENMRVVLTLVGVGVGLYALQTYSKAKASPLQPNQWAPPRLYNPNAPKAYDPLNNESLTGISADAQYFIFPTVPR